MAFYCSPMVVFDMLSNGYMRPGGYFRDWDRVPDYAFLYDYLIAHPYLVVERRGWFGRAIVTCDAIAAFSSRVDAVDYAQRKAANHLCMMCDGRERIAYEYDIYDCCLTGVDAV